LSETRKTVDLAPRARSCHKLRLASATPRANQFPVSSLAPNPQLQPLGRLIDFVPVDPIPRPTQHFAPVRLSHPEECIQNPQESKRSFHQQLLQFLAQSRKNKRAKSPQRTYDRSSGTTSVRTMCADFSIRRNNFRGPPARVHRSCFLLELQILYRWHIVDANFRRTRTPPGK